MKLSQYAKQLGISYKTAWRWYRAGQLDAYQTPSGTVIVRDSQPQPPGERVAIYARVSSANQKDDLLRQKERLAEYALAHGYTVAQSVTEIASGLNDHRPKLIKLLEDSTITVILIEHRERLTRFGYHYIESLLKVQGRRLEAVLPSDTDNDLMDDFVDMITSMATRIYGRRNSKQRAEQIKKCIECVMAQEDPDECDSRVQDGTRSQ